MSHHSELTLLGIKSASFCTVLQKEKKTVVQEPEKAWREISLALHWVAEVLSRFIMRFRIYCSLLLLI